MMGSICIFAKKDLCKLGRPKIKGLDDPVAEGE
jgi:hypothetical protein